MNESRALSQAAKRLLGVLVLVAVAGCETPKLATPDVPRDMTEPSDRAGLAAADAIYFAHHAPNPFAYRSGAKGLAFLLGGPGTIGIEERIAESMRQDIRDPVAIAKQRFMSRFSARFDPGKLRNVDEPLQGEDASQLRMLSADAALIDFKTMSWEVHQAASEGLGLGRSAYAIRGRALRPRDRQVVWQDQCQVSDADLKKMSELRENKHALLQQRLNSAAETCADELFGRFLGGEPPAKPASAIGN